MMFREAVLADISQMQIIRSAVRENVLSHPSLVPYEDYVLYLNQRGKGWVCESNGRLVGFCIVDLEGKNIWALFVMPGFEKQGIGRQLHQMMIDWYFARTKEKVWLSTAPKSRAEAFYRKAGWKENDVHGKGEIRFEMHFDDWNNKQ